MTSSIRYEVSRLGTFLATRATGRDARTALEAAAESSHVAAVVIDMTAVEAMTISFADEFLGKFQSSHATSDRSATLVVIGLNEDTRETINICLQRRTSAVAAEVDGELSMLGDELMTQTYKVCVKLKSFSALDLCTELDLKASNANNRLAKFIEAGALSRTRNHPERGGKEYTYEVPALPSLV